MKPDPRYPIGLFTSRDSYTQEEIDALILRLRMCRAEWRIW